MSLSGLFQDINAELEAEFEEKLSVNDKKLHEVAQRLLRLERDLKVPGVSSGAESRVERLLEEIAKEQF